MLTAKLSALAIATVAAVLCVLVAGLLTGLAVFGWHPFHRIDAPDLSTASAIGRVLAASGYTMLCMLSIAAIAFALGLLLSRGAEALAVAIAFVVVASILNGQRALHTLSIALPVHYWQIWTGLFDPNPGTDLVAGITAQVATIAVATAASMLALMRRDPAA